MWPWEHVLLAYVLYSAYSRAWLRRPPSDRAALVVPVAALLPDLVDKPLAWQLSVLPGGRSLAHSLLFALPVVVAALLLARRLAATDAGGAFAVGYLSHLPADSFYAAITTGNRVDLSYTLWPLLPVEPTPTRSFFDRLVDLVVQFSALVAGPEGWRIVAVQVLLASLALGVWVLDGTPGLAPVRRVFGSRSPS